jgi:type II secretory ATPase GspE/PulE/Tfp pilus assembly ATPase PilB-like protein
LLDLGAEPFLIASALTSIVGQRIARKICPQCREEYDPDEAIVKDIHEVLGGLLPADKPIKLYRGKGTLNGQACQTCGGAKYFGRQGIFEVFPVSDVIARLVLKRAPMKEIETEAIKEGMITMKQDGYLKALEGSTSLEEVLRVAQD